MTKKDKILRLLAEGKKRQEIAAIVGCKPSYVSHTMSLAKRPGYGARWMREKRKNNPRAYAAEKEAYRIKWKTDPDYRRRKLERLRRWQEANREHYNAYQREWHRRRRQQEASP